MPIVDALERELDMRNYDYLRDLASQVIGRMKQIEAKYPDASFAPATAVGEEEEEEEPEEEVAPAPPRKKAQKKKKPARAAKKSSGNDYRSVGLSDAVREWVRTRGGIVTGEFKDAHPQYPRGSVDGVVYSMARAGYLKKVDMGTFEASS